jgi:hypothetical protein
LPQNISALDGKVYLCKALITFTALPITWTDISHTSNFGAFATTGFEITPKQLNRMTIHTQYVSNGGTTSMTNRWSKTNAKFLLADWAVALG